MQTNKFKQRFWLAVYFIYLVFSTGMIATGIWPAQAAYINLAVQIAALFIFDIEHALYSAVLAIPFYLVLPNAKFDTLSQWRIVFLILIFLVAYKKKLFKNREKLFSWDNWLAFFAAAILISIFFAADKYLGIKKFAFVLNAYFIYVAFYYAINTKEQLLRAFKAVSVPLFAYVVFGFVQLAISWSSNIYYFWQYWATVVARPFYGAMFSDTSIYSNSWFSFDNHVPSLRMFSLLPDSHSFAVICVFSILFASALIHFYSSQSGRRAKTAKIFLWIMLVLSVLGIVFSGTRGVWAGLAAPIIVLAYLFVRHYGRQLIKPMFIPIIIFLIAIVASPLINRGVDSLLKQSTQGNFLSRATSIYSLTESSNAGRLKIWGYTLVHIAAEHPLVGIGYGNFETAVTAGQEMQFNLPKDYITAHSLYLDVLAETGILGLAGLLAYFFKIWVEYWEFFKKHYLFSNDVYVFFTVNAGLYILWLLAYSLVDGTMINDRVLMFFFITLALSARIMKIYNKDKIANA